jgi:hypothetical protein
MTSVSNASATLARNPNPLLELAAMVNVAMEYALGKATAALSGVGAELRLSTVLAHPTLLLLQVIFHPLPP